MRSRLVRGGGRALCALLAGGSLIACSGSAGTTASARPTARTAHIPTAPTTRTPTAQTPETAHAADTADTAPTKTTTPKRSPHHARSTPLNRPLAGRTVGVDPGHNGRNYTDPTYIDHQIWNGREYEDCNTTGTETDGGYTEALFNWNVATYLVADLKTEGARVVLTRHGNDGVGPCVNRRAQIMNRAHVAVAVAIHADGGPPDGRGFTILEPVADGINDRSIHASYRFARILRARFLAGTPMGVSTYDGVDGLQPRDDLAGENLTREPYALIECGNMRNATDAALLVTPRFQRRAAAAIAAAITRFLSRR